VHGRCPHFGKSHHGVCDGHCKHPDAFRTCVGMRSANGRGVPGCQVADNQAERLPEDTSGAKDMARYNSRQFSCGDQP
jgi:hypothetical protein